MQTRVSSAYQQVKLKETNCIMKLSWQIAGKNIFVMQRVHLLWAAMGFIELEIQSKLLIDSK